MNKWVNKSIYDADEDSHESWLAVTLNCVSLLALDSESSHPASKQTHPQ